MAVSGRLRFEVLRRDNYTCRYCGAKPPAATITVDHVIPATLGGRDEPGNLVACCAPCNSGKASINPDDPLVEQVESDAVRWAKAMEHAAGLRRESVFVSETAVEAVRQAWSGLTSGYEPWAKNWEASVEKFVELGLNDEDLLRFVTIAFRKPGLGYDERWKYLCGCCWKEIARRQDIARALLDEDGG